MNVISNRAAVGVAIGVVAVWLAFGYVDGRIQRARQDRARDAAESARAAEQHARAESLLARSTAGMIEDADNAEAQRRAASIAAARQERLAREAAEAAMGTYLGRQCKELIAGSLHDPTSAEWIGEPLASRQPDGSFRVYVTVRAKNGFNAYRRQDIACVARGDRIFIDSR